MESKGKVSLKVLGRTYKRLLNSLSIAHYLESEIDRLLWVSDMVKKGLEHVACYQKARTSALVSSVIVMSSRGLER